MQLSFDAADRLVELVQARRGPVTADEAARALFALERAPVALARSLLGDVVDGDARLAWLGAGVGLAGEASADTPIEDAELVVFDLETTGLSASRDRICEIGAARVRSLAVDETFETLVNPGALLPSHIAALTGIRPAELRRAPRAEIAVRRFLGFAGESPLVAHNARFDLGFLDREVERLTGLRVAAPVVDTVWLARRLLHTRSERVLPQGAGALLRHLLAAMPSGAPGCTGDGRDPGRAPRARSGAGSADDRRCRRARRAEGSPTALQARAHGGRAVLAGRLPLPRSQRDGALRGQGEEPPRAAALVLLREPPAARGRGRARALERIEWHVLGSEVEAALEELRLIRELRPPANARGRSDRHVYLARRGERWAVVTEPGPYGPLRSKRRASLAARALDGFEGEDLAGALPALRARLRRLARDLRFEDAARTRDRLTALEEVGREDRGARTAAPGEPVRPGARASSQAFGAPSSSRRDESRPCGRSPGAGGSARGGGGLAEAALSAPSFAPEDADELLVIAGFLRRPGPELRVVSLDAAEILAA